MRLTIPCFLFRRAKPPGKIWTGKHRMFYRHNEGNAERLGKRFAIEEQNMFYLRHSFLNVEQQHGYAKELGKNAQWLENIIKSNVRPYKKDVRVEDRLTAALNVANRWD